MDIQTITDVITGIAEECPCETLDEKSYEKGWQDACRRLRDKLSSGRYFSEDEESYWIEHVEGMAETLECRKCGNLTDYVSGPLKFCSSCGSRMLYIRTKGERKCLY